jgi:hypothetical protein
MHNQRYYTLYLNIYKKYFIYNKTYSDNELLQFKRIARTIFCNERNLFDMIKKSLLSR